MYLDPSGRAWEHWAIAAGIVVLLVVATVLTAGSAIAGFSAIMLASSGLASSTLLLTVLSFATVGAGVGLSGAAIYAALSSSNANEFAEYGDEALIATGFGGGYGALGGYCSYKQQIVNTKYSWSKERSNYWKDQGYQDGRAPNGEVLHHTYGRYGAKINMYSPLSPYEHAQIHQMYGYGNYSGGYNQYYPYDNIWTPFRDIFR